MIRICSCRRGLSECSTIPWKRTDDIPLHMPRLGDEEVSMRVRKRFINRITRAVPGRERREVVSIFEREMNQLYGRYYPGPNYTCAAIELYRKAGMKKEALGSFETAKLHGVIPTPSIINEVLLLLSSSSERMQLINNHPNVQLDSHCYCTLLSRSSDLAEGLAYLTTMSQHGICPTVVHYNALLSSQKHKGRQTLSKIIRHMRDRNIQPDSKSFAYLIYGCESYDQIKELSKEIYSTDISWYHSILRRLAHVDPSSLDLAFGDLLKTAIPTSSSFVLYLRGKAVGVTVNDLPLLNEVFATAINRHRRNPHLYEEMLSIYVQLGCRKEAKRLRSKLMLSGLRQSPRFKRLYTESQGLS